MIFQCIAGQTRRKDTFFCTFLQWIDSEPRNKKSMLKSVQVIITAKERVSMQGLKKGLLLLMCASGICRIGKTQDLHTALSQQKCVDIRKLAIEEIKKYQEKKNKKT